MNQKVMTISGQTTKKLKIVFFEIYNFWNFHFQNYCLSFYLFLMKFFKVQNREICVFCTHVKFAIIPNEWYCFSKPLQTHQLFEKAIGSRATRKCDLWLFHANVVSPRQIRGSRWAGGPAHQLGFGPALRLARWHHTSCWKEL